MKVGDYVRTKNGVIAKCIEEKCDRYVFDKIIVEDGYYIDYEYKDVTPRGSYILKSSPNIIDLIEVGDYVNGLKVSSIGRTYHGRKDKAIYCDYCEDKETGKWAMIYDDEIKSIVTKEQFESMKYKVGE